MILNKNPLQTVLDKFRFKYHKNQYNQFYEEVKKAESKDEAVFYVNNDTGFELLFIAKCRLYFFEKKTKDEKLVCKEVELVKDLSDMMTKIHITDLMGVVLLLKTNAITINGAEIMPMLINLKKLGVNKEDYNTIALKVMEHSDLMSGNIPPFIDPDEINAWAD